MGNDPTMPPASALTFDQLVEGTKRYDAVIKIEVFTDAFDYECGWPVAVSKSTEAELEALNLWHRQPRPLRH